MILAGRATDKVILPPVIVSGQRQVSGDNDNRREVAAGGWCTDNQRIVLAACAERPVVTTNGGLSAAIGPDFVFSGVFDLTEKLLNTNPSNPPGDPDTNPDAGGLDQWPPPCHRRQRR
jgi:hypothetical protein